MEIKQKWVVYDSALMHERQEKTFNENLSKDLDNARKSLKKISSPEYACEPDARVAAERWLNKNPRYLYSECTILPVTRRRGKSRGRPKSDEDVEISYKLSVGIEFNDAAIADERRKLGRFILATNDPTLSADTLLEYYKGQGVAERGFRFLKDKSFRVSEFFLKKNSRIQALAMIMVFCLFIYSMTEFRLRRELERSGQTVISQTKNRRNALP